ncbi:MAG: UDP-N-acetylmuramoyl-L-alanine--D-glutamate ligase, partial [Clostridia bacterium]
MQNLILKYASYRVGFVGLGISNMQIAKLFCENGIDVTLRDKKNQVGDYSGFKCIFGEDYLNNISEDILFLSPAVRDDLPELLAARKNGVKITNELEEFFSLCPCKTIGVTGSDGKTTTTTLIAKILEHAGKRVFLGGNIGKNLFCELPNIRPDDFAVCELSSFQLMKMMHSPNIAILKNIAPNHLDWHKDMDEYVDAKKNIFKYQTSLDLCILGADNEYTNRFACEPKGRVVMTSGEKILDNGVYFNSDGIFAFGKKIISDRDIFLVGRHNRYNYADAIAATIDFVSPDDVKAIAISFGGVKHRVQFVCEKNGIKYYNSSMDS